MPRAATPSAPKRSSIWGRTSPGPYSWSHRGDSRAWGAQPRHPRFASENSRHMCVPARSRLCVLRWLCAFRRVMSVGCAACCSYHGAFSLSDQWKSSGGMKGGTVLSTGTMRHGQAARKFRRRYGRVCNGENSLKFQRYTEVDGQTEKDCGGATIYYVLPDDMRAAAGDLAAISSTTRRSVPGTLRSLSSAPGCLRSLCCGCPRAARLCARFAPARQLAGDAVLVSDGSPPCERLEAGHTLI